MNKDTKAYIIRANSLLLFFFCFTRAFSVFVFLLISFLLANSFLLFSVVRVLFLLPLVVLDLPFFLPSASASSFCRALSLSAYVLLAFSLNIIFLIFSQDIKTLNNGKHNHSTKYRTTTIA